MCYKCDKGYLQLQAFIKHLKACENKEPPKEKGRTTTSSGGTSSPGLSRGGRGREERFESFRYVVCGGNLDIKKNIESGRIGCIQNSIIRISRRSRWSSNENRSELNTLSIHRIYARDGVFYDRDTFYSMLRVKYSIKPPWRNIRLRLNKFNNICMPPSLPSMESLCEFF